MNTQTKQCLNLCQPGFMAHCTANNKYEDQKECKYYQKASIADHCMYFRQSMGSHCDCLEAQKAIFR